MLTEHDFIQIVDAFSDATGMSETAISAKLFDDSRRVPAIRGGATITVRRFNAAIHTLAKQWPIHARWPLHHVTRHTVLKVGER